MSVKPLRYAAFERVAPPCRLNPIFSPLHQVELASKPPADPIAEAFEAGRRESQAEHAEAIERLASAIRALGEERADLDRRYRSEAASFISKVLSAVTPRLSMAAALDALVTLNSTQSALDQQKALRLRAHPSFCEEMRRAVKSTSPDFTAEFESDESIPYGSLKASWRGGGMELETASAIDAIIAELDRTP